MGCILGKDLIIRDCIIISLGRQPVVHETGGSVFGADQVTIFPQFPSLWDLLKLWWEYRKPLSRSQDHGGADT